MCFTPLFTAELCYSRKATTQPTMGRLLLCDAKRPFVTAGLLLVSAGGWGNPLSCLFPVRFFSPRALLNTLFWFCLPGFGSFGACRRQRPVEAALQVRLLLLPSSPQFENN